MTTELPADIAAAIEKFEASAWSHGFQRRTQSSDPNSRAALDAAILARLATAAEDDAEATCLRIRAEKAEAAREGAEAYAREVGAALVGLTCDGSEFYLRRGEGWRVDPAACADYIRRQRADKHDSILRFAKRAKDAEAERDAALARAERLERFVDFVLKWRDRGPPHGDPVTAWNVVSHHPVVSERARTRAALSPAAEEA